ncbi:MAG: hypothetical protein Aurels2KO_15050 [Aureliella sp.]
MHSTSDIRPIHVWRMARRAAFICLLSTLAAVPFRHANAEVTAEQRRQIADLATQSKSASLLFAKGDMEASAEAVRTIQSELLSLLRSNPDPVLLRLARPLYQRLATAHGLLELEAVELDALPTWKEISKFKPPEPDSGVSFVKDVAPWLITRCGNCHIDESRGGFAMRTFANLRRGTSAGVVLFPGSPRDSRIVEVIETGDMPRGGGQISTAQLDNLKAWIAAGAKFDGPDPNAPMREYVFATRGASGQTMTIERASGDESVSFLADVAPLFIENCNGCHLAARQASGGLRLDSLSQLLAGGDSGSIVQAGKPSESLLVRKLKGLEGQRMPAGGRPALSDQQIAKIETWILEGAKFDGANPDASIVNETQRKWAETASHAELLEKRKSASIVQWNKVQPNDAPTVRSSDDLIVLGSLPEAKVKSVERDFIEAAGKLRARLKIPNGKPIVKGGISVYLFESRYDYSEFGQMIENRELPRSWRAHWAASGVDVYAAAMVDSGWTEESAPSNALHALAGAYFGALRDVPYWFAEGAARHIVVAEFRRGSPLVARWQSAGLTALQRIRSSKDLLDGKVDEDAAGVAGLRLASVIFDRRNTRRADALLKSLREGKTFDAALSASFGSPEAFAKTVLGK